MHYWKNLFLFKRSVLHLVSNGLISKSGGAHMPELLEYDGLDVMWAS